MKMLRALVVGSDRSGRREVVGRLDECQFECVEAEDCMIVTEVETSRLSDLPLLQIVQNGGFGKSPPPVIVCSALWHDAPWSPNRGGLEVTLLGRPFTPRAFADALDAAFPVE